MLQDTLLTKKHVEVCFPGHADEMRLPRLRARCQNSNIKALQWKANAKNLHCLHATTNIAVRGDGSKRSNQYAHERQRHISFFPKIVAGDRTRGQQIMTGERTRYHGEQRSSRTRSSAKVT